MLPHNNHDRRRSPIRIVEVGPRDGLQHEPTFVPTARKIDFINGLSQSGVAEIEIGSFVSPMAVPQLADSDEVARAIDRIPGVTYSALVPNLRGLERAKAARLDKIAVFTAASNSFTRRNIKATIDESFERMAPVVSLAKREGLVVRGYVSTVVWCPYEGRVEPARVAQVVTRLRNLGVDEISLGETMGKAAPPDIRRLLDRVSPLVEPTQLALHLHDTYGMAVANALTAWWDYDIATFDTSAGGLGGCPYAPGASGNVATEDLVFALKASGAAVPVDESAIVACAQGLIDLCERPLQSRLSRLHPSSQGEGLRRG
ncbi:MAG: 3-hydroxy-3-isohexenylglutaryl-CoA/hydroxy-methylglutaryl-CoA lyase [Nitrospirae bacterium]|nr:3-hydroxy-3-isohexenylglutaryl-CoA/hydroxy-methylglutaryl-CoA lyase [Nitrospirota bacterium]MCE7964464.1 hydroxymethylglutaryl-CoA lyase [Nitrospira sp. NTP2]MCK6492400.1 hydroxymethylglutaryl-CoA lyase [Nitrospira sp.]MEB2340075.1 hydroxymethylglutaryl-CoA lyase [Nitrospirales bacterium]QOJ34124.1 MAG: hydroxymethylglutaryl-CoA lyase [Nitrospira sp.]